MAFFSVVKGQDAYVEYTTIVEAATEREARMIASSWQFNGTWRPNGNINQYDDSEVFEDRSEEVQADTLEAAEAILAEQFPDVAVLYANDAELDTIIAALRFYQAHFDSRTYPIIALATEHGPDLKVEQIDELIEEINLAEPL